MQTPTKRRNISCTWCSFFHARTCANRLVAAVQLDVCSLLHISRQCVSLRQDHVVEHVLSNYPAVMSELNNITRGPDGWTVRIVRVGEQHSKYFRFSESGIRKSLAAAKRWRDARLRELGKRQWHSGPRKRSSNNTSGTTGISKNVYGRWVATWQEEGVQRFKTFKTKKEAIAHRKKALG